MAAAVLEESAVITKTLGKLLIVGVLAISVTGAFASTPAFAKDGDVKTVGILASRPAAIAGTWTLASGQAFVATSSTQVRGAIAVGDCVKVAVRSGAVHEISKEPMRDCR
jgi:hypothetical protein